MNYNLLQEDGCCNGNLQNQNINNGINTKKEPAALLYILINKQAGLRERMEIRTTHSE